MGFRIFDVKKDKWKNISNITVKARKEKQLQLDQLKQISKEILTTSLVDHSESEMDMLEVWYKEYLETLQGLGF